MNKRKKKCTKRPQFDILMTMIGKNAMEQEFYCFFLFIVLLLLVGRQHFTSQNQLITIS